MLRCQRKRKFTRLGVVSKHCQGEGMGERQKVECRMQNSGVGGRPGGAECRMESAESFSAWSYRMGEHGGRFLVVVVIVGVVVEVGQEGTGEGEEQDGELG